jgi:hypothetical protein
MLNRTGPCSRSSSVHSVILDVQLFTSVVVVYLCTHVDCLIMFEHSPRFCFAALRISKLDLVLREFPLCGDAMQIRL